jgi:phosphoribosylformylglycinamidine cyclo-ligase
VSEYAEAGVDLEAAAKAVDLIGTLARSATRSEVVEAIGGFAGLFRISEGRLLACAADGVGTKTEIARLAGRLDTVGIDLVAMCADDVACTGAEPLLFLDYVAAGKVVPEEIAALVEGVAEGCRRAGCALLGGETAEHPGVMEPGRFDLAGFCVGVVDEDAVLGPDLVREGDVLIGLASTGLHSNGYSLVRRMILESGSVGLGDMPPELEGKTLAEELLEPTAIYAPTVVELTRRGVVSAAAHVTGGGISENLARVLPEGVGAELDVGSWARPAVFDLIQRAGGLSEQAMREVFNLGLGMILVVPSGSVQEAIDIAGGGGHSPHVVGRVARPGGVRLERLGSS